MSIHNCWYIQPLLWWADKIFLGFYKSWREIINISRCTQYSVSTCRETRPWQQLPLMVDASWQE